jgi:hypothetical protein
MQLADVTAEQAETIVTVLGAVATARGTVEPTSGDRAVIGVAATHLLGAAAVPADLGGSIPGVVAERLTDPATRELTLAVATVLCFDDATAVDDAVRESGAPDPVRIMVVDDLARYLRVSALDVVEVRRLAKVHHDLVALDLARRTNVGATVAPGETRLDIDARRVHALWHRIEQLPSGTVGAELVRYYRDNGWAFPGTDHHQPLTVAAHDVHHVLGGYPTTRAGELGVGAFTAGAAARPLDGVLRALTWAQAGASGASSEETPGVAAGFRLDVFGAAFERGARTTGDFVANGWDPWAVVDRDLEAVRAEYQIDGSGPLARADAYDTDPLAADR